jgi:hypothetical protein
MKARRSLIAVVLALSLVAPAMASAQSAAASSLSIPISQVLPNTNTLTGQLTINSFKVVNGQLTALGTLTARMTDTAGTLLGTVATPVAVPVAGSGSCTILHLTLGPLDLNLLGLLVHLNEVVLDISAQPGPGNLLGNLLCSIADLFNGGSLNALASALNQLLAAL